MKIKWYWPMEMLGLVVANPEPGISYRVSSKCEDLVAALLTVMPVFWFTLALGVTLILARLGKGGGARSLRRVGTLALLVYALLLTVGIGPYIQLYPQGSGFLDLSALAHFLGGIRCCFDALGFWLGGKLGEKIATKT